MSQANVYDPRAEIQHDFEAGQVYEDARTGDELTLLFVNEDVALLRDENPDGRSKNTAHRLQNRTDFESNVGADRYKLTGDTVDVTTDVSVSAADSESVAFEDVDGIGQKTADNLRKSGYTLAGDVESAPDDELLDVGGMGESNLANLRSHIGQGEPVDFEDVSGIGGQTASNLRRAGYETDVDVRGASDDELLAVDGMGQKNLDNLREDVDDS